ncbi:hypothetical protein F8C76_11265 [Flagellimonas olearia]|uniref:Uncharacterized protein n=1 Tax=Flagellimonas olearia TaxID=552546 RepID=A0A6I1DUI0_9FLAO|nr:hypothetical protein [Allomuricauda olearia]KAB7528435.1 hypothetical protein F8C76_11265 [Allomuricauda olearia]
METVEAEIKRIKVNANDLIVNWHDEKSGYIEDTDDIVFEFDTLEVGTVWHYTEFDAIVAGESPAFEVVVYPSDTIIEIEGGSIEEIIEDAIGKEAEIYYDCDLIQ